MVSKTVIKLASPNISEKAISKVGEVLRSGNLVQGKYVREFEAELEQYLGVKHAIVVSSGTAALHLSLLALGIGPGDEVIVPAFTFPATANVVVIVGAKPVFVDISLDDYCINVTKIEEAITPKTKAIMPVHEFGMMADMDPIIEIANRRKLLVIEDAACALGAKENDQYVGSYGQFGSFSFHPRKAITSGEGGVVTTNVDQLAKEIRILRNHGIEIINGKTDFVRVGFNYRMTDFQAALVNTQFDDFDSILDYKQELSEIYLNNINNEHIFLPMIPDNKKHTWQTFHLLLKNPEKRDALRKHLLNNKIMTNYGAQCIPHMTYYKKKYNNNSEEEFPNAYKAFTCGLAIPLYDLLKKEEAKYISESINGYH